MRKKSIKQVKTRSPMKILFLGLMSKKLLLSLIGCRGFGVISSEFGVFDQGFNAPNSELPACGRQANSKLVISMKDCSHGDRVSGKKFTNSHSPPPL
jgi:hypothetical protein